ncbi:peptidase S10, partial [bacterium]|nr:peptidase S10 [bacterium]
MRRVAICLIFLLSLFSVSFAQEEKKKEKKPQAPEFKPEFPKEILSSTKHTVAIGGTSVSYTATAGNILLKQEDGRPKANFFFISYVKDGVQDSSKRPLTYSFNGGPGSSSVWLHMGVLGPKRVEVENENGVLPPPYKLIDNEYSMLDVTDLVFIDPVTTGYSRAVPGESDKQYHGVREDVESVGEFIRLYTTRFKRWSSPKFLIGESYGTTRAANLVNYLQERHGMYFNGVMLVSSILQMQTARFDVGNDLPY